MKVALLLLPVLYTQKAAAGCATAAMATIASKNKPEPVRRDACALLMEEGRSERAVSNRSLSKGGRALE